MVKYRAKLIFYSWTLSQEDTAAVKRIQRLCRRENLVIVGDTYTCNTYTDVLPDELRQMSQHFYEPSESHSEGRISVSFEHQYTVVVEKRDPVKLQQLVSLLQAYASYIGIHSRLIHFWQSQE